MPFEITKKIKIYAIIFVVLLILWNVFIGIVGYYKSLAQEQIQKRVESVEIKIDTVDARVNRKVLNIKSSTKKSRKIKSDIVSKKSQNEENIDNTSIDDNERKRLLSEYEERAKNR